MKLPQETYAYMTSNPWELGLKKQRKSDVLKVRLSAKKITEKRKELRQAIVQRMSDKYQQMRIAKLEWNANTYRTGSNIFVDARII